jgi:hypothetical protein
LCAFIKLSPHPHRVVVMKKYLLPAICAVFVGLMLVSAPASAQQKTAKACADEWKANKEANQAAKITEKAYVTKCRADSASASASAKPAAAAPAPAPTAAPAAAPAPKPAAAAPAPAKPAAAAPSGGKAAEVTRIKACGADWKADKAAGKVPAGQKWPQYWSECNKRKKAAGM